MKRSIIILMLTALLTACGQAQIDPGPQTDAQTTVQTSIQTESEQTTTAEATTIQQTVSVPEITTAAEQTTAAYTAIETTAPETEPTPEMTLNPAIEPSSVIELSEDVPMWEQYENITCDQNLLIAELVPDIKIYGSLADGDGDILDRQIVRIAHHGTYDEFCAHWIGRYGSSFNAYGLTDCDGDGEDEIAVSLTEGTGTGFYMDGLTVFDFVDGHYKMYALDLALDEGDNSIYRLLDGVMDIDVHNESQSVFINGMEIDLDPYYNDMSMDDMVLLTDDDVHYTNHIHFDKIEDGKIIGWAGISIGPNGVYFLDETVEFEVHCTDGKFSFENVHMVIEPRWES